MSNLLKIILFQNGTWREQKKKFCFWKKKNAEDFHRMLVNVYGETVLNTRSIRWWIRIVNDRPCSSRPSAAMNEKAKQADTLIIEDSLLWNCETLWVSHGSACSLLLFLGYSKICAKWDSSVLMKPGGEREWLLLKNFGAAQHSAQRRWGSERIDSHMAKKAAKKLLQGKYTFPHSKVKCCNWKQRRLCGRLNFDSCNFFAFLLLNLLQLKNWNYFLTNPCIAEETLD